MNWTATGNTLQQWTGILSGNTGAPSGKANPYTWTQTSLSAPGPEWYWSDTAGPKTVTCTATVTPPAGQGNAFTVNETQSVILDVPTWSETDSANPTRIDSLYPKVTGPALWAGSTVVNNNGSQWNDGVTTPSLYVSEGNSDWAHLQIITINGTHSAGGTATPVPNNNTTGLDGNFPYRQDGNDYKADGTIVKDDGDSPGINLADTYTNYNLNYSFDLYVMYIAPGDQSIWVPLTKLTWTWNPNVTDIYGSWANWPVGTSPGGSPMVPSPGTRCIDEPTWTTKISEH